MGLADDLGAEVVKILKEQWITRDGIVVPDTPDLKLANDAVVLDGTVLYADLADSTGMVLTQKPHFAAEVYKCYLNCACRIIRAKQGEITAFDGDRVMAVFLGEGRDTRAVRAALAINHAVVKILNPRIAELHPKLAPPFVVQQSVGIDRSKLFVARTGIRGSNDLVWVGRAANFAAKLCSLREGNYATWITDDVFQATDATVRLGNAGESMWEARQWTAQNNMRIHRSAWTWPL